MISVYRSQHNANSPRGARSARGVFFRPALRPARARAGSARPAHVLLVAAVFAGGMGLAGTAQAQEPETTRRWTNGTELSWIVASGNSDTNTIGFRNLYERAWTRAELTFEAGWVRAASGSGDRVVVVRGTDDLDVIEPDSEIDSQRLYGKLRYQHEIAGRQYWFSSWDSARDEPSNILRQFVFAGGVGTTWHEGDTLTFRTSYGISFTDEYLTLEGVDRFGGYRLFYGLRAQAAGNTAIDSELTADGSFQTAANIRMDWLNSVGVAVNSRIALKTSVRLLFRNIPALEAIDLQTPGGVVVGTIEIPKDTLDVNLTTSLVVTF